MVYNAAGILICRNSSLQLRAFRKDVKIIEAHVATLFPIYFSTKNVTRLEIYNANSIEGKVNKHR